jgi:hypothetical protein
MSIEIKGQVGPQPAADGSNPEMRQGRDSEVITADAVARFSEATRRRKTFCGMTAVTGTTIVAANVSPVAAAAASILSLYNPLGSGVDLHLLASYLSAISGTMPAGAFVYNIAYNQAVTATQNNGGTAGATSVCTYGSGAAGVGRVFTQTALTGSVGAQTLLRPIGASWFAAVLAASTVANFTDAIDGAIVLPPGGLLSIAAPAAGTTVVMVAGFEWMEIGAQI